jgi:precorrin isomerase
MIAVLGNASPGLIALMLAAGQAKFMLPAAVGVDVGLADALKVAQE